MASKIIISGGGTGGHIFPAIAIANALRRMEPQCEILFVGAEGKMEMEKIPAAGYKIVGLDIQGFNRQALLKNFALPFKLLSSLWKARRILRRFRPDVVVGVGGYASGPLLMMASVANIPGVLQEQNSYAGLTNKLLSGRVRKICVAYDGMERFFSKDKIIKTGNPIRREAVNIVGKQCESLEYFDFSGNNKTVLVTGGSLGAGQINKAVKAALPEFIKQDIQLIWQCGSYYYDSLVNELRDLPTTVQLVPFLDRMDYAYAAADIIVARAGAGTISELCVLGKPVILVPSPNVSDDHQTENAKALVAQDAAVLIKDEAVVKELMPVLSRILNSKERKESLGINISKLALPKADEVIAKEIMELIK